MEKDLKFIPYKEIDEKDLCFETIEFLDGEKIALYDNATELFEDIVEKLKGIDSNEETIKEIKDSLSNLHTYTKFRCDIDLWRLTDWLQDFADDNFVEYEVEIPEKEAKSFIEAFNKVNNAYSVDELVGYTDLSKEFLKYLNEWRYQNGF